ncbi:hypothetical protein ATANTOWER_019247 [Ataeniobius toweri]|uniref:Uncharacterized protein n=1 Tax=Ataeniobius toweri TaxID=208326 RepID=A0ABU7BN79_9TELE|nr:hypothetical protein [Ataeniobius toweri]
MKEQTIDIMNLVTTTLLLSRLDYQTTLMMYGYLAEVLRLFTHQQDSSPSYLRVCNSFMEGWLYSRPEPCTERVSTIRAPSVARCPKIVAELCLRQGLGTVGSWLHARTGRRNGSGPRLGNGEVDKV